MHLQAAPRLQFLNQHGAPLIPLPLGHLSALLPLPARQHCNLEALAGLLQLLEQIGNFILCRLLTSGEHRAGELEHMRMQRHAAVRLGFEREAGSQGCGLDLVVCDFHH